MRLSFALSCVVCLAGAIAGCNLKIGEPTDSSAQPPEPAEPVQEVAEGGVGKRGRIEDRSPVTAPLTTPANAYSHIKQNIVFKIQIPDAMKHYKFNNDGKGPQSHEEFMEGVIKANGIKLPELLPTDKYVFDVEKQQLMVEHPPR